MITDLFKELRFWKQGQELKKFADAMRDVWQPWEDWLNELRLFWDMDNAPLSVVDLRAWGRMVKRLPNEPESLYRTRVAQALDIVRLGGVRKGLDAALTLYGITGVTVFEQDTFFGEDTIRIEPGDQALDALLLREVIRERGRACRNYVVGTVHEADLYLGAAGVSLHRGVSVAVNPGGPVEIPSTEAPFYLGAFGVSRFYSHSIAS